MISLFKEKVALFWKFVFYFSIIASILSSVFIGGLVLQTGNTNSAMAYLFQSNNTTLLRVWSISLWIGAIAMLFLYWRSKKHLDQLNNILKDALTERKLDISLTDIYSSKNLVSAINNVKHIKCLNHLTTLNPHQRA